VPRNAFSVETSVSELRTVIAVRGEVDLLTAPDVTAAVAQVLRDECPEVVIDLRSVTFMDSSGVIMLETVRDLSPESGRFKMIDGVPPVSRVLEITGRTDVLPRLDPAEL
jgi:anti-sigma B factor antagonist